MAPATYALITLASCLALPLGTQAAQTAEPKEVPGLPDQFFPPSAPLLAAASAPNTAEPKPVAGIPDQAFETESRQHAPSLRKNDATESTMPPVVVASSPVPDAGDKPDWYGGASIGRGGLDTGYQRTFDTIFSTGATAVYVDPDVEGNLWKLFVGYRILPSLSIEGSYWKLGGMKYKAAISAPVVTSMERQFDVKGFGLDALYWLPLSKNFSGFARLGGMGIQAEASAGVPGAGLASLPEQKANTFNLHWGLGGQYVVSPELALRLEYETIVKAGKNSKFGNADIILWSAGAAYRF